MTSPFTLTLFTPGEAEKITGLSTAMQRDWRHRGFLPKNEGHARFDAFGLAAMLVLKIFSDRGIGPQFAEKITEITARSIVWHALSPPDMFEGDLDWEQPENSGRPEYLLLDGHRRGLWYSLDFPPLIPPRFLVVFADGSEWWDSSIDAALQNPRNATPEKLAGPIIVLDQEALGDLLADRVGRPLVHIEANSDRPS
jgi:hypothetical protein